MSDSTTRHTPGPWTYSRMKGVTAANCERVLVDGVSLPTGNHPQQTEAEANARLFAAAPDLLDACTVGLRELQAYTTNFDFDAWMESWGKGAPHPVKVAIEKMRDAIAKASGGA